MSTFRCFTSWRLAIVQVSCVVMRQCFLATGNSTAHFWFSLLSELRCSSIFILKYFEHTTLSRFLHARVVGNFGLTPISYLSRTHDTWKRLSSWDSSVIIFFLFLLSEARKEWRILVPNNLPKVNHFNFNCFCCRSLHFLLLQGRVSDFSLAQYLYWLCELHRQYAIVWPEMRLVIASQFEACASQTAILWALNTTTANSDGKRCNPSHCSSLDRVHIS